jgi:hypothetical protein
MFIRLDKKFVNAGSLFDISFENAKIEKRSGILSFIVNDKIVVPILNIIDNYKESHIDYYIELKNILPQDFVIFQEKFDLHEEESKNSLDNVSVVKMMSKKV